MALVAGAGSYCQSCETPVEDPPSGRIPCPKCGGLARHFTRTLTDSLQVWGELTVQLRPGSQARDWKQRWIEIQAQLQRVVRPRTESMSGPGIQTAQHELRSFFVQAYHLKDALKDEAATTNVSPKKVEDAITKDPHLALLADL